MGWVALLLGIVSLPAGAAKGMLGRRIAVCL